MVQWVRAFAGQAQCPHTTQKPEHDCVGTRNLSTVGGRGWRISGIGCPRAQFQGRLEALFPRDKAESTE